MSSAEDGIDHSRRNRDYDRDEGWTYDALRERERERERRYRDPGSDATWNDEDYYRGLLGGQGGSGSGGKTRTGYR